jgi:ATPase subunit of ABC transporter with duplicated ATPase domains
VILKKRVRLWIACWVLMWRDRSFSSKKRDCLHRYAKKREKEEILNILSAQENADVAVVERVHARLLEIESDQAVVRAAKILHGLGFDSKVLVLDSFHFFFDRFASRCNK